MTTSKELREIMLKCLASGMSIAKVSDMTHIPDASVKSLRINHLNEYRNATNDYNAGKFTAEEAERELGRAMIVNELCGEDSREQDEEEPETVSPAPAPENKPESGTPSEPQKTTSKPSENTSEQIPAKTGKTREKPNKTLTDTNAQKTPDTSAELTELSALNTAIEAMTAYFDIVHLDRFAAEVYGMLNDLKERRTAKFADMVDWRLVEKHMKEVG